MIYHHPYLRSWRWIAVIALLLASCDSVGSEQRPQVTVRFIQSNVSDGTITDVVELAAFELPVNDQLRRDAAFSEAFTLPEDDPLELSFGIGYSGRQDYLKDDILFWFVEESESSDVVTSGVMKPFSHVIEDETASTAKSRGVLDGSLYAFSVDGIGEVSAAPLELSIGAAGEERSFTYHPERHRLPADRVLMHVDETALKPFLPLEAGAGFTIEVTARGLNLDDQTLFIALAKPIRVFGTRNGKPIEGSKILWQGRALSDKLHSIESSGTRSRVTYLQDSIPEKLDFYLIALGAK